MDKIICKLISENSIMIFSKDYCPFSHKTKAFLNSKSIEFHNIDMDLLLDGAAMQKALKLFSGVNRLPLVYIAGKMIGGFEELQ